MDREVTLRVLMVSSVFLVGVTAILPPDSNSTVVTASPQSERVAPLTRSTLPPFLGLDLRNNTATACGAGSEDELLIGGISCHDFRVFPFRTFSFLFILGINFRVCR